MSQGHTIITDWVYPPIPERRMDWSAVFDHYDGAPDAGGTAKMIGRGPTELSAIADLLQQEREHEEGEEMRRLKAEPLYDEHGRRKGGL